MGNNCTHHCGLQYKGEFVCRCGFVSLLTLMEKMEVKNYDSYMYLCIGTGSHGQDEVKDCDILKPPFETTYIIYMCAYGVCTCVCVGS